MELLNKNLRLKKTIILNNVRMSEKSQVTMSAGIYCEINYPQMTILLIDSHKYSK